MISVMINPKILMRRTKPSHIPAMPTKPVSVAVSEIATGVGQSVVKFIYTLPCLD